MVTSDDVWQSELEAAFSLPTARLQSILQFFLGEMERGLSAADQSSSSSSSSSSSLKMIPSFVDSLPAGTETGRMLALDLGGTNFRVFEVVLKGDGAVAARHNKYKVSDAHKVGPAEDLFGFLAECIKDFLVTSGLPLDETYVLGFTFSFPVDQTSINSGTLIEWTKDFTCTHAVGRDVCLLLDQALRKLALKVRVAALVNDTVGTLIAHAYQDTKTVAGVILGTGTNAAYVEKVANIPKWHGGATKTDSMVINIEWGGFDNQKKVLPVNKYDASIDAASGNPGVYLYEKMVSGHYLGELARLIFLDLATQGHLFAPRDRVSVKLHTPHSIETDFLSLVESDTTADLAHTKKALADQLAIATESPKDLQTVHRICHLIGLRAARLAAVGVAAVVNIFLF